MRKLDKNLQNICQLFLSEKKPAFSLLSLGLYRHAEISYSRDIKYQSRESA